MTIVTLRADSPLLADLLDAIEGLQAGVRVGLRDSQTGSIYRIQGAAYDTARMAVVFSFDSSQPVTLPAL